MQKGVPVPVDQASFMPAPAVRLPFDACPFGPRFFLEQLGGLIRDRCPDASEHLPRLHLQLASGEVLEICHVMGIAPRWVALAVFDRGVAGRRAMRTELVPYETIARLTIRRESTEDGRIGFDLSHGVALLDMPPH